MIIQMHNYSTLAAQSTRYIKLPADTIISYDATPAYETIMANTGTI